MAEQDKIEIEVTVEGTAEAAQGLDQVTASLDKQRRTQEMIAKTQLDLQRRARIEDIKKEAAEVNNVSQAFRTVGQNAVPATEGVQKLTFQFGQFRSAAGASGALIGNLGRSFSQIVPSAAGFTSSIQSGVMAMSQFLGVLGGGPGMVVAGVVGGVALLASAFASANERAEELAEQTKKNAKELEEYLKGIKDLRATVADQITEAKQDQEYEKKFRAGQLTSDQYAGERQTAKQLYAMRGEIDRRLQEAYKAGEIVNVRKLAEASQYAQNAPARGEQARVFEQAARAREAQEAEDAKTKKQIANAEDVAKAEEEQRQAALTAARTDDAARKERREKNERLIQQLREREQAQQTADRGRLVEDAQAEYDQKIKLGRQLIAEQKKQGDKQLAEHRARETEKRKIEQRNIDALKERNKAFTDAATNAAQIGANTTIKFFSDLAKGHKAAIGAVLEGIGDQMVAEGTRVLFQAAAMAFFPPLAPAAGGLAAVGGAEIAAGIALGAVGARGEGGSNSGGGGAAARGGPAGGGTNYADPFAGTARYGGNATGPTVININFPTVLTPTAADGERIVQAVRQANRTLGTRL